MIGNASLLRAVETAVKCDISYCKKKSKTTSISIKGYILLPLL